MGNHYGFCSCIQEDEVGAVEKFGEFQDFAQPGFHCFPVPCIWGLNDRVASTRVLSDTVRCETKTKDNVFVELSVQILFSVDRENRDTLYQLFYRVDDFLNRVDSYVKDIIRAKVPLLTLDELFEDTSEIKRDMTERMTVVMAGFGYVLRETLVVDLDPNPKVKASMNEIETEKRLRVAAYDEGEAKKIETVILGEAAAEEKRLNGEGMARMRDAIIDGVRSSLDMFKDSIVGRESQVTDHEVMDLLLITQYFDYLAEVGGGRMSFKGASEFGEHNFLYHNPGAMGELRDIIKSTIAGGVLSRGTSDNKAGGKTKKGKR